jgi:hypothetical protein
MIVYLRRYTRYDPVYPVFLQGYVTEGEFVDFIDNVNSSQVELAIAMIEAYTIKATHRPAGCCSML